MSNDNNNTNTGGGRSLGGGSAEPLPQSWSRPSQAPRVGRIGDWSGTGGSSSNRSGSRFGTIGGLSSQSSGAPVPSGHRPPLGDDSDDDEEDESRQRESWFAGGERSGLSIQNPDHQSRMPGGDVVRDLLRRAAEAGPARDAPPQSNTFRGGGHRLGSDEVEATYIPDPDAIPEDETPAIRNLTFWSDGFSLEDGPLMRYDNPEHAQILAQLRAGQAPPDFLDLRVGQPVDIRIAQRTHEAYIPPQGGAARAFSGSGNRLGAPVPEFSTGGSSGSASMPGGFPTSQPTAARERDSMTTRFEVDQSLPTTSVQVRLADGTRSRPENLSRAYTIGTTFPNRTLDDLDATIEAAGLVNSVVVSTSVFVLLFSLCFLGFRRRSIREKEQQEAIAAVYQIEPSQIHGPPTTYVTSFDARSPAGFPLPPSAYISHTPNPPSSFPETPAGYPHTPGADSSDPRSTYNFPTRSVTATGKSPHVHFPPTPETRYQGRFSTNLSNKTPQTAPVNPAFTGGAAYPFPGYSPVSATFDSGAAAVPLMDSTRNRDRHSLTPLIRPGSRDSCNKTVGETVT
ncbi:hypothetical protein H0H92_015509 [Tricholoma furcatifolium]|nr:hypothetical protein H0H92_015509 [Tricholoma furcatifolium]